MAEISKPVNGAFVLSEQKASEFFENKVKTSSEAIRRLENRNADSRSMTEITAALGGQR